MSTSEVNHPLFARFYTKFSQRMEPEFGEHRTALLTGLSGRVLEIGAGNGMNFAHYGTGIDEVVALEPEAYMRSQAEQLISDAVPPITIVDGSATKLPFEDASFDSVIFCLVLCSIDDPAAAIEEAKRVLKPSGDLRFFEHVRSTKPTKYRIQSLLDKSRIWPGMAGGCHCSRDSAGEIAAAGFRVEEIREMPIGPAWGHTNPHVIGSATRQS